MIHDTTVGSTPSCIYILQNTTDVREFLRVRPRNTTSGSPGKAKKYNGRVFSQDSKDHARCRAPSCLQANLVPLPQHLDGTNLDVDEDAVPQEHLQTLMPTDLLGWFNFKTFGIEVVPFGIVEDMDWRH